MRAILEGFAGVAPRSSMPNLIEMLGTLFLLNRPGDVEGINGAGTWMVEILFSVSAVYRSSTYVILTCMHG
jgi:hypothetical protein